MSYVVIATWVAKLGEEEYVAVALAELTPGNRAEPKMLSLQAHRALDAPARFVLVETYTDADGYEEHRATQAFQARVVGDIIPRLADRDVHAYTVIET
ncbi:antibiotic biosynthesis monooxygenase [Nocardia sp. CA2R105]|uniref:putative quinol monooxygenase n=1 Tax=Nocardia coffeae TaxID=2873381 RepID=UPI001CA718C0|nr:antibiotic biosynthesis monooxygenase [Nocardia coffeae]MBY8860375.1 antibiotic biosynthesis monooxygenase [Nocardia coffeae]